MKPYHSRPNWPQLGFSPWAKPRQDTLTDEEMAAQLSAEEGREVTILEVRRIEMQAIRKIKHLLRERGLAADMLLP